MNAVNPGLTDSGWLDEAHRQRSQDRFLMGQFGQPDAARLVNFLASEQSGWITGQVIIHSEGGGIKEK
ncbi:MAG TPA: hypothetical protein VF598_04090 [Hymenobacter sp.]